MLHIRFGDMDQVAYGPRWFKYNYDISWFQDPFVRKRNEYRPTLSDKKQRGAL